MGDGASSVTLIFYKVGDQWWKEPALNLLAAAAQFSSYTHVEIAIGEAPGQAGMMANVARIYNDNVGVELCQRTGRNPQYTYLSLGCSKAQEQRMVNFARQQVGKPFSNSGMARSIIFPRTTTGSSYYCAELVAAILKQGGLMSGDSNPGAATPYSLYRLYSKQAAATANPYTLRQVGGGLNFSSIVHSPACQDACTQPLLSANQAQLQALVANSVARSTAQTGGSMRRRDDSPPRASFKVMSVVPSAPRRTDSRGITLSLSSLR